MSEDTISATAKTHGMDRTRVDADWPPLTLAEARALLDEFLGCGEAVQILSVSPRPFSSASVVATRTGRVFIKRHHGSVRDREGLLEEHRFMNYLREHGAPVPFIFADASGETAIERGEWSYEVHEAPPGVDLYEDALSWTPFRSTTHAHSAGAALARLHLAAQGNDAPRRKARPLVAGFTIFADDHPSAAMDRYLAERPSLADYSNVRARCNEALELLAPFHSELRMQSPALEPLWTHNDLHGSNLLWSAGGDHAQVAAIIDFGLADRTNAVHDLAHAIERSIVEWLELKKTEDVPVHLDQLNSLLSGYQSVRPLTEGEAEALAPMTAVCHAEFALTEADYFLGVLHSEMNARVCVEDYLVGHARWYRRNGGNKLLNAIRGWAGTRKRVGE
jgi:Ser/Thr protein kinase RdoA (MazF antagonist)